MAAKKKLSSTIAKRMKSSVKKVKNVTENGSKATQDVPESSEVNELLQSGVKAHKARSGADKELPEGDNSLFQELGVKESSEEEKAPVNKMKTADDISEEEIERAHKEELELPDFDFRTMYEKGQKLWFVRYSKKLGNKELVELNVRTVYARMIIGLQPKSICHCIGVNMRDQLFEDRKIALQFYNSLDLTPEEKEREKNQKSANADDYDEDDGDMTTLSLEEAMKDDE